MNGWFRDATVITLADGSKSISLYKLDGRYDNTPHSVAQRLRVYDETVAAAMVTLVHLYRNSVGGLIDQEARKLLAAEFNETENTRWKWMFSPSGAVVGDTAASLNFASTAGGVSQELTTAITAMPGSSKYLLLKQVPTTDTGNACAVYNLSDKQHTQATIPLASGIHTVRDTNSRYTTSYTDPTLSIQFGTKLQPFAETGNSSGMVGVTPLSYKRACHYKLVAGVPINPPTVEAAPVFSSQVRADSYASVSAPIPADVFNPYPTRMLGCAGVYDGIGRPGSAWFARARFKAFMATVNKKRRIDVAEAEYDMSDVNGYIADDLNRRETIAVSYATEEMRTDAVEIVALAATALVGEATTDWYVERDPLAGMSFENRVKLMLPPKQINSTIGETDKCYVCHTYTDDTETWENLFPKKAAPSNPGHNAQTRHAHYARLAATTPKRSKVQQDGMIPQRPYERRVYTRDTTVCTVSGLLSQYVPPAPNNYVGCGFSETVVEPMATEMAHTVDGLTMGISDISKMYRNPETEFADNATQEFCALTDKYYTTKYTLVPADPSAKSLGSVHVNRRLFVVGTTPAAFACASKLTLAYIDEKLPVHLPATSDERSSDRHRRNMTALATHYMYESDPPVPTSLTPTDIATLCALVQSVMKTGQCETENMKTDKYATILAESLAASPTVADKNGLMTRISTFADKNPVMRELKVRAIDYVCNNPATVLATFGVIVGSFMPQSWVVSAATLLYRARAGLNASMAVASTRGSFLGTEDAMRAAGLGDDLPWLQEADERQASINGIDQALQNLETRDSDIRDAYTNRMRAFITPAENAEWSKWHADAQAANNVIRQKYLDRKHTLNRQSRTHSMNTIMSHVLPNALMQSGGMGAAEAANAFANTIAAYQNAANVLGESQLPNMQTYIPVKPGV